MQCDTVNTFKTQKTILTTVPPPPLSDASLELIAILAS
jgi:hypothetical protein